MAITWNMVARNSDCGEQIVNLNLQIGANSLLITEKSTPEYIHNFYLSGETLYRIPIQTYSSYNQEGYRPGYFVFYAGKLYGHKLLDISALYGGLTTDIAQVFAIDPNIGTLALDLDTWKPVAFEKSYVNCWRTCFPPDTCPASFPDFPTDDEIAAGRRSYIDSVSLDSYAGRLHAAFHSVTEPKVWYEDLCLFPRRACVYHDGNKWADAILMGTGGGWSSGYRLILGDVPYGTAFFPNSPYIVHHETQAVAIFERAGGNLDVMYHQPDGWERLVTNEATIVYPDGGFGQLFWKVDGNDLKWADSDLRAAAWQLYHTYPRPPHLPPCNWGVDTYRKPIIACCDPADPMVRMYYGTVHSGNIDVDDTDFNSLEAIGCVTHSGDYVVIKYVHAVTGKTVLEVWKRGPGAYVGFKASPLGMDIDTGDGQLYITGEAYLPSGVLGSGFDSLIHLNLLWSVDTTTMSSCMQYWTSVSGGWLYPHAGSWSQLYLYGYAGPDCKAVLINDMPEWGGWPATVILQPTTAGYIGGLHASPFFDGDDIHFAVVTTSGWLGSSSNAGTTYKKELDLPYPVDVVYRNIMSDSAGSGYASWIGAKGSYACPIKVTVDLNAWGNRCTNLPAVTVTDIDSFD